MKDATIIRNLKRSLTAQSKETARVLAQRDLYGARAVKAEAEAADWKRRFDLLLEKCGLPKVEGVAP